MLFRNSSATISVWAMEPLPKRRYNAHVRTCLLFITAHCIASEGALGCLRGGHASSLPGLLALATPCSIVASSGNLPGTVIVHLLPTCLSSSP